MRVQLHSDIHFEFHKDKGDSFISSLDPSGVDLLILAGDVINLGSTEQHESLVRLCELFPIVVYVPGNHEYYGTSFTKGDFVLKTLQDKISNLTVLDNSITTIEGKRFFGGTMWFGDKDPNVFMFQRYMNDFSLIKEFLPEVFNRHRLFLEMLEDFKEGDVVISHHLPCIRSVPAEYKASRLNCYFLHEMSSWIMERKPDVWVHGHTHSSSNYEILNTRVYCNAFGGYDPNPRFIENFNFII